uniref:Uncharacterized protein n=1 Tax=Arundo donax TaxID=35708 RepID=A0A0A8Z1H3_ARUDO
MHHDEHHIYDVEQLIAHYASTDQFKRTQRKLHARVRNTPTTPTSSGYISDRPKTKL